MSELAFLVVGIVVGFFIAMACALQMLVDRKEERDRRESVVRRQERVARCAVGQHREILVTATPYLHVRCLDCPWCEELGIAHSGGTNKRTRRAS